MEGNRKFIFFWTQVDREQKSWNDCLKTQYPVEITFIVVISHPLII